MEQQPLLVLLVLLFLWLGLGPVHSSVIRRWYRYEHRPHTWQEAHEVCRRKYSASLATVLRDGDISDINMNLYHAWFGLKKQGATWEWVDGNEEPPTEKEHSWWGHWDSDSSWDWDWFKNVDVNKVFAQGEPVSGDMCGKVVYSESKAHGDVCDQKFFIFCEGWRDNRYYHFFNETKTWPDGLDYCKNKGLKYMRWLTWPPLRDLHFPVWIGLHRDGASWSWRDGIHSDYRKWPSGKSPGPNSGTDVCVAVSSWSKSMLEQNCSKAFPFLCYGHNVLLVQELLSWEQALETCRNLTPSNHSSFYSMLSVEPNELQYALSHAQNATTSKVWVGLRFLGDSWFWTDGSGVSLSSLPECPESGLHCGALVLNRTSGSDLPIEPSDCSLMLNVLCYGEP